MRKAAEDAWAYVCEYFEALGQDLLGSADGGKKQINFVKKTGLLAEFRNRGLPYMKYECRIFNCST